MTNPSSFGLPLINVPADIQLQKMGSGSDELMVDDGEEIMTNNDATNQTSDVFSRLHVRADRKRMRAVSPRIDTGVVLQNMNSRETNIPSWELTSDKHDAHKS